MAASTGLPHKGWRASRRRWASGTTRSRTPVFFICEATEALVISRIGVRALPWRWKMPRPVSPPVRLLRMGATKECGR
ncbi:MAG: hypothetical protein HY910_00505 [Desulfarculus sp.]|nr:hypothetical protein [Desulfarculus sp.]